MTILDLENTVDVIQGTDHIEVDLVIDDTEVSQEPCHIDIGEADLWRGERG